MRFSGCWGLLQMGLNDLTWRSGKSPLEVVGLRLQWFSDSGCLWLMYIRLMWAGWAVSRWSFWQTIDWLGKIQGKQRMLYFSVTHMEPKTHKTNGLLYGIIKILDVMWVSDLKLNTYLLFISQLEPRGSGIPMKWVFSMEWNLWLLAFQGYQNSDSTGDDSISNMRGRDVLQQCRK